MYHWFVYNTPRELQFFLTKKLEQIIRQRVNILLSFIQLELRVGIQACGRAALANTMAARTEPLYMGEASPRSDLDVWEV